MFQIAEQIRGAVDGHDKSVPAILEIPSKEHPYDASKDSILRRARVGTFYWRKLYLSLGFQGIFSADDFKWILFVDFYTFFRSSVIMMIYNKYQL